MNITEINKKALFVGIDKYDDPEKRLYACVKDAQEMCRVLEQNENGDPNFPHEHIQFTTNLRNDQLKKEIEKLFDPKRAPDHALFYFSGHGYANENGGYLVGRDYTPGNWGVSMEWLIELINSSKIPFITIILDCCYADAIAKHSPPNTSLSTLRENVTILSATKANDTASEGPEHGAFTKILIQGLRGAAADVFGRVTAASLYSLADGFFSPLEQRPVFKSSLTKMPILRSCISILDNTQLRELGNQRYFPNSKGVTQLKPTDICSEPSREKCVDHFEQLIQFQRSGLIECTDNQSVYKAALGSKTYKLSAFGEFFLEMVNNKRF